MKKLFAVAASLAVLLAALLTAACGSGSGKIEAGKIRFVQATATSSAGQATFTSLPQALGYWRDSGLDVEFVVLPGTNAAVGALAAGQADMLVAAPSGAMLAASSQGISNLTTYYTQTTRFFQPAAVLPDSPITSYRQLEGKTVGVASLESGTLPFVRGLVKADGGDPTKVKFIAVGFGIEALTALATKKVDALGLWSERYSDIKSAGGDLRLLQSEQADRLGYQTAAITSTKFIEQNRDAAIAFAQGIAKANIFARENPEAAVRLHWTIFPASKPTGVDEAAALEAGVAALKANLAEADPVDGKWGFSTREQVTGYRDFLAAAGVINASKVDIDTVWDDSLINDINKFDAEQIKAQARNWKP